MSMGTVTVDLTIDTSGFAAAMHRFAEGMKRLGEAVKRWHEQITASVNDVARVAGLEGMVYVRAGLDPRYADEAGLNRLVQDLLRRPQVQTGQPCDALLTNESRALLASAAMRGWCTHRQPTSPDALAWHRLMNDGTVVRVGRTS